MDIKTNNENDVIQIIFDPYEDDVQYIYEIDKKKFVANAFIINGRLGPVSSFYKVETDNLKNLKAEKLITIKKISNAYETPLKGKNVLRQLSILSFVDHPNIIKLLDIVIPEKKDYKNIYLIEENMGSNLEKLIVADYYDYKKDEKFIPWVIYQILQGIHYLHSCKIMHRDIKSSNILLDERGNIKICGFGNAISFDDYENTFRGEINDFISEKGSLTYQAPEILASKKKNKTNYDEKIDLWGVGCIMAELYTKICPFFPSLKNSKFKWISQLNGIFKKLGKPSKEEIKKFASKEREKDIYKFHSFPKLDNNELFPNVKNEKVLDLMGKFLCINPKERITLKEAINHPYFDVIKEYQEKDDFIDSDKIFINEYENKIKEMEKNNTIFNEQILFYQNEILLKQKNFHINV